MERDSFIFYRSFYEALEELKPLERVKIYDAICKLALNGESPDLKGIPKAIFSLIEPQINANNMRYTAGKKGGAPKGNSNAKKQSENNQKQPMVELGCLKKQPKNNQKQPNENVNENVNENENENENVNENVNENENVNVNVNDCVSFCKDNLSCSDADGKEKETQHTLYSKTDRIKALVETYFGDELKGSDLGPHVHLLRNFDEGLIEVVFKSIKKKGGKYGDAVQQFLRYEHNGKG